MRAEKTVDFIDGARQARQKPPGDYASAYSGILTRSLTQASRAGSSRRLTAAR